MQFKSIVSQKAFWKSVFWLGLSFLVLYNVITILFEYGEFAFALSSKKELQMGNW